MDLKEKLQQMDFDTADMFTELEKVKDEEDGIAEIIKELENVNYKINQLHSEISLRKYRIAN